jgi:hypothetical protein
MGVNQQLALLALAVSPAATLAATAPQGDGSCPCPAHPGRTYCPLDKSPGQCEKASHPPCKRGGACPAPPPGPPECRSVKVVKQLSSEKCVLGKTFGCNATGDSIWIAGCRGYFSCNGSPSFECSVDGPGQHYCQCSGMPAPAPPGTPHFHGCVDSTAVKLPYCNTSLSRHERLDDLMSRLTQVDKVSILTPSDPHSDCGGQMGGVAEIGLPPWHWLTEANTNIAVDCIGPGKCATLFVGPEGMAASFNRTSWRLKGGVLGTEMRVFNMFGGGGNPPSLTGYGPNINIARWVWLLCNTQITLAIVCRSSWSRCCWNRDPRFGRNSELPGEDPLLSGVYATEMINGMQERDASGYPKMAALLKHFTA